MYKLNKTIGVAIFALYLCFLGGRAAASDFGNIDLMNKKVSKIAKKLDHLTGMKSKFKVVPDIATNAIVMPDNTILISSGLISACETEDEIAFVLAHEAAHILAEDNSKRNYAPALSSPSDLPESQLKEITADLNAVYYIKKAGYNPNACVSILSRISPESNSYMKNRIDTLTTYLKSLKVRN